MRVWLTIFTLTGLLTVPPLAPATASDGPAPVTAEIALPVGKSGFDELGKVFKAGQLLDLGDLQRVEYTLNLYNDNLLFGGARLMGVEPGGLEGDDFGQTSAFQFSAAHFHAKGQLDLRLNSELFTRRTQVDGKAQTSTGRHYLQAVNIDSIEFGLRRDTASGLFVVLKLKFASLSDQSGFALAVQEVYHEFAHRQGWGGRLDEPVPFGLSTTSVSGAALLGYRLTLVDRASWRVETEFAAGARENYRDQAKVVYEANISLDTGGFKMTVYAVDDAIQTRQGVDAEITLFRFCASEVRALLGLSKSQARDRLLNGFTDDDFTNLMGVKYVEKLNTAGCD